MQRSMTVVCLFGIAATLLSGCSSLMAKSHMTADGALTGEAMSVTARPREFGLQMLGDAEGTAMTEKFLFFTLSGDKTDGVRMPVFGQRTKGALETLACYRAAKSNGGDAFYNVATEVQKESFLGIYRKYSVRVKGKSLKLTDLGDLSAERADGTYDLQQVDIDISAKGISASE